MIDIIKEAISFEKCVLRDDSSGHDYEHPLRVERIAFHLSEHYECNRLVVRLAALLHDVDDIKLFPNNTTNANLLIFFQANGFDVEEQQKIINIINFLTLDIKDDSAPIEAKIVQDADNLDALGAIGIARLFAFGGWKGIVPISCIDKHVASSEKHYYERLKKLPLIMNTKEAYEEALKRIQYMDEFMEKLRKEATLS